VQFWLAQSGAFAHSCELTTQDRDTFVDGDDAERAVWRAPLASPNITFSFRLSEVHAATTFLAAGAPHTGSSTAKACRVWTFRPTIS